VVEPAGAPCRVHSRVGRRAAVHCCGRRRRSLRRRRCCRDLRSFVGRLVGGSAGGLVEDFGVVVAMEVPPFSHFLRLSQDFAALADLLATDDALAQESRRSDIRRLAGSARALAASGGVRVVSSRQLAEPPTAGACGDGIPADAAGNPNSADASAGSPWLLRRVEDLRADVDGMRYKQLEARSSVEHLKTSLHQWTSAELAKVQTDLRELRSAVGTHESELQELSRSARTSQASLELHGRLLEDAREGAAKLGGEMRQLAESTHGECGKLQGCLEKGLEAGRALMSSRAEELQNLIRESKVEQVRALDETQAWRVSAEARLSELDGRAAAGQAAHGDLQRLREEFASRGRQSEADQRALRDALGSQARALADTQARCSAELHRRVHAAEQQLQVVRGQQTEVQRELDGLQRGLSSCREWATEQAEQEAARKSLEAERGRAELEQRLSLELGAVKGQLTSAVDASNGQAAALRRDLEGIRAEVAGCRAWAAEQLETGASQARTQMEGHRAESEQRLSSEVAALAAQVRAVTEDARYAVTTAETQVRTDAAIVHKRFEDGLAECRAWAAERLRAEAERRSAALASESSGWKSHFAVEKESILTRITSVQTRLGNEDAALGSRIDKLTSAMSSLEGQLEGDFLGVRAQLEADSAERASVEAALQESLHSLSQAHSWLNGEFDEVREIVQGHVGLLAEHAEVHGRLRAEAEQVSAACASAASGEELQGLRVEVEKVEKRLSEEDARLHTRALEVASDLGRLAQSTSEADRKLSDGLDRLEAALSQAEQRRCSDDSVMLQRIDSVNAQVAESNKRLGDDDAFLRSRLEKESAEQAAAVTRLTGDVAALTQQLAASATAHQEAERQLNSEDTALREEMRTLRLNLASTEARSARQAEDTQKRFEEVLATVVDTEARLAEEDAVTRDHLDREFEALEGVVRDVETRALPWRSSLSRAALAIARSSPQQQHQHQHQQQQQQQPQYQPQPPPATARPHQREAEQPEDSDQVHAAVVNSFAHVPRRPLSARHAPSGARLRPIRPSGI